jgi:4-aminobutyrate aminotransferase-like enzyme
VLEIVEEDQLMDNVNKRGVQIKKGLTDLQSKYSFIDTVRGKGLMMGVEFTPTIKDLQSKFIDACFKNGLLVYPAVGGTYGKDENGIIVSPPFIITPKESDELLQRIGKSLNEVSREL